MNPSRLNGGAGSVERARPVHLEDYWHVVWRRGWLVLLITVVSLIGALWAASRRPQLYRANLTLQVGDPRGRTGQLGDIDISPNMLWTDPVESELQQLTTQAVARFVVDTLQLRAATPGLPRTRLIADVHVDSSAPAADYRVDVKNANAIIRRSVQDTVAAGRLGSRLDFNGIALRLRPDAADGVYTLRIAPDRAAISRVIGGLAASGRSETNLIDVTFTDRDPLLAPQILNAVAAASRRLGVRRVRQWAESRTAFIETQLHESGADLQRSLEAVEDYKKQHGLTSLSSEENRLLGRLSDLQSRMEQLVIERNIYNDVIRRISGLEKITPEDVQQLATLSDGNANRAVQFYFDRLLSLLDERSSQLEVQGKDPSHPEIRALDRRIEDTQGNLVEAARQGASSLQTRISAVDQSLTGLRRELARLPAVETQLSRLQNQVEISTDMYKYLLSKYQEAQIAEAEISPYVEVVDPATWARPVGGGGAMNVIFGGLIGLVLGLGAAFFLEYLDRSVQSTEDVESRLGLPVLGWIPRIESDPGAGRLPVVAEADPSGSAAEAYRVLRTNLAFSTAREERLVSLLFTSPGPAEGKSTTVANLAAVLAGRGDRTLLIDADLRRGELHRAFDLLRSPGLSDLLASDIDPREAIRPEVRPGLDILPAGHRPPNPSELLGSNSMSTFLETQRESYRWILLDAPPVLAVTDPAVLAARVDGTVLVMKAGETDQRAAWRCVQQLERINARLVGAVLNEIRPGRSADGYYLDYYYTRYSHRHGERIGVAD